MAIVKGDVVTRVKMGFSKVLDAQIDIETRGRVCRVVNPDFSYMVRFDGASQCVLQFADSITKVDGDGPDCLDHTSCKGL
jgi:hypothetical protein